MERSFKGIWIPAEIWLNEDLSIQEKVFLVEIDSLDNEEGCFASNDYFSKFFKLSKNRCSEIIKGLETKGLLNISYKYKEGTKSIEKRIIKVVVKSNTSYSENRLSYSEKCEDNNTFNNTNNNVHSKKEDEALAEEIWKLYPHKKGKSIAIKKIPSIVKSIGKEKLIECIDNYKKYIASTKSGDYIQSYMGGDRFFRGMYQDYLEEVEIEKPKPKETKSAEVRYNSNSNVIINDINDLKAMMNEFK